MSAPTNNDLERFVASVEQHLLPAARRAGFTGPSWIPRGPGETLCALRGEPFHLLVYLASGHGINMTVCASPQFRGEWNPHEEVGLAWLCRALGLAEWQGDRRYASYEERDTHIAELAARLPAIIAAAKARGPSLWADVQALLTSANPPSRWR